MADTGIQRATFRLQLREPENGDGRTLEGIVVPYDEVTHLTPQPEVFLRGSLNRSLAHNGERVKLFLGHDHSNAIGQARAWDPDHAGGCWGQFRLFSHAVDLMGQVREGALDGFSIGFRSLVARTVRGVVNVREAALHEVSLVPLGAYDGARVLATRSPDSRDRRTYGEPELTIDFGSIPPVDLTPIGPVRNLWS
jgi:HK97 family phage prohead protease